MRRVSSLTDIRITLNFDISNSLPGEFVQTEIFVCEMNTGQYRDNGENILLAHRVITPEWNAYGSVPGSMITRMSGQISAGTRGNKHREPGDPAFRDINFFLRCKPGTGLCLPWDCIENENLQ